MHLKQNTEARLTFKYSNWHIFAGTRRGSQFRRKARSGDNLYMKQVSSASVRRPVAREEDIFPLDVERRSHEISTANFCSIATKVHVSLRRARKDSKGALRPRTGGLAEFTDFRNRPARFLRILGFISRKR